MVVRGLTALDAAVLGLHQRAAHRVQRWVGISSLGLASAALKIGVVHVVVEILGYWWPGLIPPMHRGDPMWLQWFTLTIVLPSLIGLTFWLDRMDWTLSDVLPAGLAMIRPSLPMRLVLLSMSVLGLTTIATMWRHEDFSYLGGMTTPLEHVALVLYIYFVNVDPLPPCRGKVREWLASFRRAPLPVSVES